VDAYDYPVFCDQVTARVRARLGKPIFGVAEAGRARLRAASPRHVAQFLAEYGLPSSFAMFIAWPRSGHSLLGALLDAHPDMAFAHELHACGWFFENFTRDELFYFCWQNARHHGLMGRRWREHDYTVPGQWQGRVRRLCVLGDKKGGETSLILSRWPDNLANVRKRLGTVPLKLIHAVRHPLDTIAAMTLRWEHRDYGGVHDAIDRFRRCAAANAQALRLVGDGAITVWHEDLIAEPRRELRRLAAFFDVTPEPDWLEACAAIVRPSVDRSRDRIAWTDEQLDAVRRLTDELDFLRRYRIDP